MICAKKIGKCCKHILIFSITLIIGSVLIYFFFGTNNNKNVQLDSHVDDKSEVDPDRINFLTNSNSSAPYFNCDLEEHDFAEIIASAYKSLTFYEEYSDLILPDGIVGARVLEAQCRLILENRPDLPQDVKATLTDLYTLSKSVSDANINKYANVCTESRCTPDLRQIIECFVSWFGNCTLWEMPSFRSWKGGVGSSQMISLPVDNTIFSMNTNFSDRCTTAVFEDCCTTQDDCFELFLGKRRYEYYLTHGFLFLLFAKQNNCFTNEDFLRNIRKYGEPENFMATMSEHIWNDAIEIEKANFPPHLRDLFVEQVLFCSLAGYRKFLRPSWLKTILSWQSSGPESCFYIAKEDFNTTSIEEFYGGTLTTIIPHRRIKRYDSLFIVDDKECSTHFTAVALATTAMYLRSYVEFCF